MDRSECETWTTHLNDRYSQPTACLSDYKASDASGIPNVLACDPRWRLLAPPTHWPRALGNDARTHVRLWQTRQGSARCMASGTRDAAARGTMMKLSVRCHCGELRGEVASGAPLNHGVCYCKDCQAFAYALGTPERMLDDQGGTRILQTAAHCVRFTAGQHHLRCLRLTPNGLARWYAGCCNTGIGNTPVSPTLGFVGLIGSCLTAAPVEGLGPPRMKVWTSSAWGTPKPRQVMPLGALWSFLRIVIGARFARAGSSPFHVASGATATSQGF